MFNDKRSDVPIGRHSVSFIITYKASFSLFMELIIMLIIKSFSAGLLKVIEIYFPFNFSFSLFLNYLEILGS